MRWFLLIGLVMSVVADAGEVQIAAHRGASAVAPENTVSSIRQGIEDGADLVEFDVMVTADGHLVLFHDAKLKRTAGVNGLFVEKTLAELRELEVGSWFGNEFRGEKIPTLQEAVDACGEAIALIERKTGSAESYAEALRDLGENFDKMVVQSFDSNFLKELHELLPELRLGLLGKGSVNAAVTDLAHQCGAQFIGWKAQELSEEQVDLALQEGLEVFVWTVNGEQDAVRFRDWGVSGIITDRPLEIRKAIDLAPLPKE